MGLARKPRRPDRTGEHRCLATSTTGGSTGCTDAYTANRGTKDYKAAKMTEQAFGYLGFSDASFLKTLGNPAITIATERKVTNGATTQTIHTPVWKAQNHSQYEPVRAIKPTKTTAATPPPLTRRRNRSLNRSATEAIASSMLAASEVPCSHFDRSSKSLSNSLIERFRRFNMRLTTAAPRLGTTAKSCGNQEADSLPYSAPLALRPSKLTPTLPIRSVTSYKSWRINVSN